MSCLVSSSEAFCTDFCTDLSKPDESLASESYLAFFSQKTESESSLKYGIRLANDRIFHNFKNYYFCVCPLIEKNY